MKIAKNFKKTVACLLAFAVVFTCIGSALAVSAETPARVATNGNGNATDVGIWYTTYNCDEFWAHRFAGQNTLPVGYDSLLPDGTYGVPYSGNTDIIDFHIQEIADAGIDFIMFDLTNGGLTEKVPYGWGVGANGNCWNVNFAKLTAQRISKWNETHAWKIRYAVSVGTYDKLRGKENFLDTEDFTIAQAAEWQAEGVVNMFLNDQEIGDDYYTFDGKPLITLFDWDCKASTEFTINDSTPTLKNFTVRDAQTGQKGTYGWHNQASGAVYDDEVVLVSPGHYNEGLSVSRNGGEFYQDCWDVALGQEGKTPRIVMISSFNDYMENTAVFVSKSDRVNTAKGEEAWNDPYQYWDMTVENIKALNKKNQDLGFASATTSTGYANFALEAEVTQSHWNFDDAGPISAINDGSLDSRSLTYANQNDDKETYIDFNFASAKKVNNVNLYADCTVDIANFAFKDVAIDAFVDGRWVRVAELHDLNVTQKKQLVPVYFKTVSATIIRVTVDASNQASDTFASFAEIQIYNNPTVEEKDYTGIADATDPNTAIAGTRSDNYLKWYTAVKNNWASWIYGKEDFVNEVGITSVSQGRLLDGKYGPALAAQGTINTTNYFYYEFDKRVINSATIGWGSEHLDEKKYLQKNFAVDVKKADGTWVRVAEVHLDQAIEWTQGAKVATTVTFPDIEAYGVNFSFLMKESSVLTISEFDAYYDSRVTSYTGIKAPLKGAYVVDTGVSVTGAYKCSNLPDSVTSNSTPYAAANGTFKALYDGYSAHTRTLTQFTSQNVWMQFNYLVPVTINSVVVLFDSEQHMSVKDMAIDVLLTNGSYKRVAEVHLAAQPGKGTEYILKFPTEEVVGVRFIGNKAGSNNQSYLSLSELMIRYNPDLAASDYTGVTAGQGDAVITPSATNVALNQEVTTSNTNWSHFADSFPAYKATDGKGSKTADCAISNYVDGLANFTVNYDKAYTINTVVLGLSRYEPQMRPDEYVVEVLTKDGWIRVASKAADKTGYQESGQTLANVNSETFTFASVECTAVRVVANNKSGTSANFRIVEIETYNYDNVTEYTGFAEVENVANIQGDVNGDYWINAVDLSYAINYYVGAHKVAASNQGIMDTNRDGKYDIRDYIYLVEEIATRDFSLMD